METCPPESGRVVSVNLSRDKGTVKEPVPEIVIDETGVVGDAHAGDWHRQVSLLGMESIERFGARTHRTFQPGEFAENITTRGIDLLKVAILDRFTVGGVVLETTQLGKQCHGDGCAIFQAVGQCVMPKEGIFCRVVQGGAVKPNDTITYVPRVLRFHVVTLSDRASQGVYEDRSGPAIQAGLVAFFANKRWHIGIERALLPDDANRLKTELRTGVEAGVDVIFTTGGTGIGPRDITPEVVTAMADKLIPGIMEHIRTKYGAQIPNALLSRSVAAVIGKTLVYALPGSVKAVNEYLAEILKTLEHAILMLHGLDAH